jgi:peptidoglycan-associated lipoprotein
MKRVRILILILLMVALGAAGCRSRAKATPPPAAAPPPVETAPVTRVETPERDFVQPRSEEDEILAGDLARLNREARERGWIADAFFAFDSSVLDDDARRALDASGRWLAAHPELRLTIEGHCDERGTQQYNLALGDRRANIAADYLAALGIGRERISTVSYGEERPFADGPGESSWRQNRRAHLVLRR